MPNFADGPPCPLGPPSQGTHPSHLARGLLLYRSPPLTPGAPAPCTAVRRCGRGSGGGATGSLCWLARMGRRRSSRRTLHLLKDASPANADSPPRSTRIAPQRRAPFEPFGWFSFRRSGRRRGPAARSPSAERGKGPRRHGRHVVTCDTMRSVGWSRVELDSGGELFPGTARWSRRGVVPVTARRGERSSSLT